jgi:hypothetical protein
LRYSHHALASEYGIDGALAGRKSDQGSVRAVARGAACPHHE